MSMSKQNFFTDGMTVEQILSLGPEVISSLNKRDMSRALRTVSLAANKRVNRLLENAVKKDGQYQAKKSGKYNIATDSLNYLLDVERKSTGNKKAGIQKFGVGDKDINQMRHEFSKIQKFMSLKSSTIKGATAIRKTREQRAVGKTREQAIKGLKGKKRQAALKEYEKKLAGVYEEFRHYIQTMHPDSFNKKWEKYTHFEGSDEVLEAISNRVLNDEQVDWSDLEQIEEDIYINRQEGLENEFDDYGDDYGNDFLYGLENEFDNGDYL